MLRSLRSFFRLLTIAHVLARNYALAFLERLNIAPGPGHSKWFPRGIGGAASALPYAVWLYLGIVSGTWGLVTEPEASPRPVPVFWRIAQTAATAATSSSLTTA